MIYLLLTLLVGLVALIGYILKTGLKVHPSKTCDCKYCRQGRGGVMDLEIDRIEYNVDSIDRRIARLEKARADRWKVEAMRWFSLHSKEPGYNKTSSEKYIDRVDKGE